MSGEAEPGLAASLEARLSRQPLLGKLLVAWVLEGAYHRAGSSEAAARMRALIDRLAPHCVGLAPFHQAAAP